MKAGEHRNIDYDIERCSVPAGKLKCSRLHMRLGGRALIIIYEILDSLFTKAAAALLAPVIFGVLFFAFRKTYRAFSALHYAEAALAAVAREPDGLKAEGPGFWLKKPIRKPANYGDLKGNSIPILLVAATKGGVGKTSLTGSLAAHFALRWNQRRQNPNEDKPLRVLVIDQDFQGSFTTMTIDVDSRYRLPSKSNKLVSGELRGGLLAMQADRISQNGMRTPMSIWVVPAYYDLAQAENRMLIEWLLPLSDRGLVTRLLQFLRIKDAETLTGPSDVRYLLAESLLHPEVQANFDLVIIDSPPRLTTSHIQAMCASTHLLVPTILDGLSGDAVARYLDQIAVHKNGPSSDHGRAICPYLQPIGVVCTLVPNTMADLSGRITELKQRIAAAPIKPEVEVAPENCFIKQRPPYREHAGERLAYAAVSQAAAYTELRAEVDLLGDWIAPRIGAGARSWMRHETE